MSELHQSFQEAVQHVAQLRRFITAFQKVCDALDKANNLENHAAEVDGRLQKLVAEAEAKYEAAKQKAEQQHAAMTDALEAAKMMTADAERIKNEADEYAALMKAEAAEKSSAIIEAAQADALNERQKYKDEVQSMLHDKNKLQAENLKLGEDIKKAKDDLAEVMDMRDELLKKLS